MGELNQVADGVWVRQSEWVWTNSIVVRGEDGLIVVDPGIDGSELNQLADDVDRLGIPTPRYPRTADRCRARSSSIRRTLSATPRSSSRTVASCSPATCSPTS